MTEMIYQMDAHHIFGKINEFLYETGIGSSTVKGAIEAFECKLKHSSVKGAIEAFECGMQPGDTESRSQYWQERIANFISNPGNWSPEKVQWINSIGKDRLVCMILAMEQMMLPDVKLQDVFRDEKPFLFFHDSTLEEFEEMFTDSMQHETLKLWTEKDGTELWETILKKAKEVLKVEDCELYIYKPHSEADPLVEHFAAYSTFYCFFVKPVENDKERAGFVLGMMFSHIYFKKMLRLRYQREVRWRALEAARAAGRGGNSQGGGRGE